MSWGLVIVLRCWRCGAGRWFAAGMPSPMSLEWMLAPALASMLGADDGAGAEVDAVGGAGFDAVFGVIVDAGASAEVSAVTDAGVGVGMGDDVDDAVDAGVEAGIGAGLDGGV
eukprot:5412531-Pyramimonas_sp.AAC.1